MTINIVCVGKIKEKFYKEAIDEYSKRLSKYCKLNIIEVEDEDTPSNASQHEEELIKDTEGERILRKIPADSYIITLEIQGNKMNSVELSDKINKLAIEGKSNVTFIIGGSLGLSSSVTSKSNMKLSFSDMTFPHQLMRVILLEQVYRSFRIINNEPYHK